MSLTGSSHSPSRVPDYAHAFDAFDDPCVFINRSGVLQATNAAFDETFCDEARGLDTLHDLFADPLDGHVIPWNSNKPVKQSQNYVVLDKQGSTLHAQLKFVPQNDDLFLIIFKIKTVNQSALERAHARLNLAFTQNLTSAIGFNRDSQSIHVSGFITELFGLGHDQGELSFEDWLDFVHIEDRERARGMIEDKSLELFEQINFTLRIRYFGPEKYLWMRHHLQITECDEEGRALQLSGQVYDVSETVLIEDQARLAELSRKQAVEIAELTEWRFDFASGDGHIEGALADLFDTSSGFGPHAWRGRVHPDDFSSLNAAFLAAEFGRDIDHRFRINDQEDGWVELRLIGASEPSMNPSAKRASGFIRQVQSSDEEQVSAVERIAADTAELSSWSGEIAARQFVLVGPILQRLGIEGSEFKIGFDDWFERVHPADRKALLASMDDVFKKHVVVNDYRIQSENGEYVWITVRGGVSQQTADGQPLKVSGVLGEMTQPKIVTSELARHERQLASAVDSALLGIWHLPRRSNTQTLRGKVLEWLGREPDQDVVPNEEIRRIVHPDERDILDDQARALFAGDIESIRVKTRLKTPEGWCWVQTIGAPVEFDEHGRPTLIAGIYLDYSAEQRYEAKLEAQTSKLENVYQNTPALLYSTDETAHITMVSDHWLNRMGYHRDEVLGQDISMFLSPEFNTEENKARFKKSMESGDVRNRPFRAKTRSGELIDVMMSAHWIYSEDGTPLYTHTVWNDVTALNKATRDLELHAHQVERVNQELNRFTTIASHDLQEPLRKVSAFSSLLLRKYEGQFSDDADRSLHYLVDAAGRMQTMISDLLSYSKASNTTLSCEAVDLKSVLDDVSQDMALCLEEADAQIKVDNLPLVIADRVMMHMVLSNLMSNAVKYRAADRALTIEVTAQCEDDLVRVCVADNGIGLDPGKAEDIFTPFVRLHGREAYEGNGIGLGICRQAIERLGGKIWAEGEPGQGSKFYFELPLSHVNSSENAA